MGQDQLVPSGINLVEFDTMEDNIVATEELTDEVLANFVPVDEVGASDGDSDVRAKPPVYTGTAVVAVDALRSYLVGAGLGQNVFAQLDTIEAATKVHILRKRL